MAVLNSKSFTKAVGALASHVDVECKELGATVRLGRLTAPQGLKLGKRYNNVQKDADGSPKSVEDMASFYVWLLSLSIVDGDGNAFLCSDEGRLKLGKLSLGALTDLGSEALILNGMAERESEPKKKTAKSGTSTKTTTSSPSGSASKSGGST